MSKTNTSSKVLLLVEGAVMLALATVLSYIRIINLPWGGSVTLLSMLPIALYSIRHGVGQGLVVSFLFSLIQFGQGVIDGIFGWGLTPTALVACILLDYILAFTVLGLAGIFRKKGIVGYIAGITLALLLRFVSHFISGFAIFASVGALWEGFYTENSYIYSLLYNGAYMLPEIVFTLAASVVIFTLPQTKRFFNA